MDGNEKVKRLFSSKIDKTAQLSITQRGLRFEARGGEGNLRVIINRVYYGGSASNVSI